MPSGPVRPKKIFWKRLFFLLLALYLILLVISHIQRFITPHKWEPSPNEAAIQLPEIAGDRITAKQIRLAYADYPSDTPTSAPPIVLIHGSPGDSNDLARLANTLRAKHRVIVPDLPGFGNSTHDIADYSIRAHAQYVLALLDHLQIPKAHLVAHSMGGGVVLNIAQLAPSRIGSISLVSAIGAQDMELLGDYYLNHVVHGAQLAFLQTLRIALPRFGSWNHADMGVSYARNFYDSDQRPLRGILSSYEGPMLIFHGKSDPLVPVDAAYEHARLMPQSTLYIYDGDHFTVFTNPDFVARQVLPFLDTVEQGTAITKATADPVRIAQSTMPMNRSQHPKLLPVTAFVLFAGLALATLVSEDLACISAGLLYSDGRAGFLFVTLACFVGIWGGDMLLFLVGKIFGPKMLRLAPFRWFISEEKLEASSNWLEKNGATVIFTSRFIPGTRLPTYLAAGLLHRSWLKFCVYFFLSAAVWTPLLVGSSAGVFVPLLHFGPMATKSLAIKLVVTVVLLLVLFRVAVKVATYKGRRQLVGWFYRKIRWEFWPPYIFYPPVFLYVLYLGLKFRGFTTFTASNPAIIAGGFVGESKYEILKNLAGATDSMLRFALIPEEEVEDRVRAAQEFMAQQGLSYPVVLKPDVGQRGAGVAVVRSEEQLRKYLNDAKYVAILQEYAPGLEFGVFYYRYPTETSGHVFSITQKILPVLAGDGKQTLERLILSDNRAVCMADFYSRKNTKDLERVLADGEKIQLVELGTHCRGAVFLDGSEWITPELTDSIDRISQQFSGFYFGRYDIRVPSVDDLKAGRNLKVIELNGVSSEATHIYDPKFSLFQAYRVLFAQWRIAYEIGNENRKRGAKVMSILELAKLLSEYTEISKGHRSIRLLEKACPVES